MIETPTVLILGAGASIPFGYPSGEGLKDEICSELKNPSHPFGVELQSHGFSEEQILEFRNNFFYSGKLSIDAFLEHRPGFMDIGKLVIAKSLIPYENLDNLFENGRGRWYSYFYNKLNTSFEDFDKNKFSIVTFNYDRSFEQFLFTALKNTHGIEDDKDCASKLEKIPIIHVHGKLAKLDWQDPDGRPYNSDLSSGNDLKQSAEGIKIIHEKIDGTKTFKEAYKLISKARDVHFLGFGYHKTNIERLNLPNYDDLKYHGTCYGLERAEIKTVRKFFPSQINLDKTGILMYLRRNFKFD